MVYKMIWDIEHTIDGVDFDTLDEAKSAAIETYLLWITTTMSDWKIVDGKLTPTEQQIDDWDAMIYNCICYIVPYDGTSEDLEKKSDDDEIYLTDEELDSIGWMTWEEVEKKLKGENV